MTEDNSTETSEDTATGTKIVEGAPVKITRARGGVEREGHSSRAYTKA